MRGDAGTGEVAHEVQPPTTVRVGVDLVDVQSVSEALSRHGEAYLRRVFTSREAAEVADDAPAVRAERLAARFAVKEAVLKALPLPADGPLWRDIELRRGPGGAPHLALGGSVLAAATAAGLSGWSISISHHAGVAVAVVAAGPPAP